MYVHLFYYVTAHHSVCGFEFPALRHVASPESHKSNRHLSSAAVKTLGNIMWAVRADKYLLLFTYRPLVPCCGFREENAIKPYVITFYRQFEVLRHCKKWDSNRPACTPTSDCHHPVSVSVLYLCYSSSSSSSGNMSQCTNIFKCVSMMFVLSVVPTITVWLIETALSFQVASVTVEYMSWSASEKVGQIRALRGQHWPPHCTSRSTLLISIYHCYSVTGPTPCPCSPAPLLCCRHCCHAVLFLFVRCALLCFCSLFFIECVWMDLHFRHIKLSIKNF